MSKYRVCKQFVVESGHMLSKHPERCRFPHGHTRTIEIVVSSDQLDDNDMVVDFKAIKMLVKDFVERFDHAMAINSNDPLLPTLQAHYPEGIVIYEDQDPTTEVMAKDIFDFVAAGLRDGFSTVSSSGCTYDIEAGSVTLERVRVWETPTSWAEFGT